MSQYKRYYQSGGHYFFTLVSHQRKAILTCSDNIEHLKVAIMKVKESYPFQLSAMVILPDHLHCLWKLPQNDKDFSTRWRLIKRYFSMEINGSINHRNEKEIWQRRFWEHVIRDENDWQKHMNYIHYNPVKHGYVNSAKEWPHSTFHYWQQKGLYDDDWGTFEPKLIIKNNVE